MAKKDKLKTDETGIDDELNMPEFDFDGGDVPDDRSPSTKLKDAVGAGVKETFNNPATYAKLAKRAFPKEYGDAAEELVSTADTAVDIYQESIKEIKPVAGQLASSINKLVPDRMKKLKAALQKTSDWGNNDGSYSAGQWDAKKQQEVNLQMQLGAIFDQQEVKDAKDDAEKKVEQGTDLIRHRDQVTLLNAIANSTNRLDLYTSRVNQAFQKKSLELQMRSYGVQVEMLGSMKLTGEVTRARLDAIAKNTGLPDFVKLKNIEAAKEIMRNKFIGGLQNSAAGLFERGDFTKNLLSNIRKTIKEVVGNVAGTAGMLAMPLDMMSMQQDLGMEKKEGLSEMAAKLLTESFVGKKLEKVGEKGREYLENSRYGEGIKKGAAGLQRWNNQSYRQARAMGFVNSNDESDYDDDADQGFFGTMGRKARNLGRAIGREVMPGFQVDGSLQMDSLGAARMPAQYSNQAQKSITEIIPGYLARILRELTITRTGDDSADLLEYDHKRNMFQNATSKAKDIKDSVILKKDKDGLADFSLKGLKSMDEDGELSFDQRKTLAEFLIKRNVLEGKTVDMKDLANPDTFFGPLAGKDADVYADFFKSKFEIDDEGNAGSADADMKHAAFSNWFHMLGKNVSDTRGKVQQHINVGDYDAVRKTGLLNKEGNGLDVDQMVEQLMEGVRGAQEGDSDVNIKENIQKINPMNALKSIKDIGASIWNYKPGSKADNGGKPMVGPMAQDVNKVLGDKFAPGGKKIDLVNMNGINMAGILDVDKKVDESTAQTSNFLNKVIHTQQQLTDSLANFSGSVIDRFSGKFKTPDNQPSSKKEEDPMNTLIGLSRQIAQNTQDALVMNALGGRELREGETLESVFKRLKQRDGSLPQDASVVRRLRAIGINVWSLGADGVSGLRKIGNPAIDAVMQGASNLKNSATKAYTKITGGRSLRDIATEGRVKFNLAKDDLFAKYDLFVEGEVEPRLLAIKLQAGDYRSKMTGKVIQSIKDIDSDIIDENGNVVLTVTQLKSTFYKTGVHGKVMKAGQWFADTVRWARDKIEAVGTNVYNSGVGNLKKMWSTLKDLADYPRDIYVRGETRPRLLGVVMRNGGYFSQMSGKVIQRPGDIDGPVVDAKGQELISTSDLSEKGIVDLSGTAVQTGATRVAQLAVKGIMGVKAMGQGLLTKGKNFLLNIKDQGMSNMGRFFDKITDGIGFGGKEGIDLLTQIRDILDKRLSGGGSKPPPVQGDADGDGVRDNSYADKKKRLEASNDPDGNKNNNAPSERKNANAPTSYATRNTFDLMGDAIGKAKAVGGSILSGAASLAETGAAYYAGRGAKGEQVGPPKPGKPRGKMGRAFDAVRSRIPSWGTKAAVGATAAGAAGLAGAASAAAPALASAGTKAVVSKGIGMALLKKIPLLGLGAGAVDAIMRLMAGDKMGALLTLASGASSMLPGFGTAASVGLDATLAARDAGMFGGAGAAVAADAGAAAGAAQAVKAGAPTTVAPAAKQGMFSKIGASKWGKGAGLLALAGGTAYAMSGDSKKPDAAKPAANPATSGIGSVLKKALFSPMALGGVGLGAFGLYKAYKWATKKTLKDIERLRFIQYGLNNGDDEHMNKIYELEQLLEPMVKFSGDEANLEEKDFDQEKFLAIFSIEPSNERAIYDAGRWLRYRFKPVFLTHVGALRKINGSTKLDDMGSLSKKQKLELLPLVSMPAGPWNETASPFPTIEELHNDPSLISEAVAWCRKEIEKLDGSKLGTTDKIDKLMGSKFDVSGKNGTATALDTVVKPPEKSYFEKVADKFKTSWNNDFKNDTQTTKTAMSKTSVESEEVLTIRADSLTALNAVRFKAYGLVKTTYNETLALNYLEEATLKEMRLMANKKVMWVGDVSEQCKKAARFFEFNSSDEKRMMRWNQWFMGRFLPVYTAYLAELYAQTGKSDKLSAESSATAAQSLTVANKLVAMASCWRVTDMPFGEGELNTDPSSCDENIEYLKKQVKDQEVAQERAVANKTGMGDQKKFAPAKAEDGEFQPPANESYEDRRKRLMVNSPVPETAGELGASALGADVSVEQQKKERDTRLSGIPIAAAGEMNKGDEANKWLELRDYQGGKANIEGLNPAMKRQLLGMIQEYGEKTGKKTGINRGFVTKEQQAKERAGNSAAAKPGTSMHEFGLAVDIDRATLNAMDALGLLKKYGFTRPVGGEPWHLEPAGVQSDRQSVKKDPKLAEKLTSEGAGKGGGGFGTVAGAAEGATNPEMAKRVYEANGGVTQPNAVAANSPASDANQPETGGTSNDAPLVGKSDASAKMARGSGTIADVTTPAEGSKGYAAMQKTIEDAARITGVDKTKLASVMAIESGFNPNAKGTGGNAAQGLGQFKPGTWKDMMAKYGKQYGIPEGTQPSDPKANAIMTGLLYGDSEKQIGKYKDNVSEADVYSSHLMGAGGAKKFHGLKDSDFPASYMEKAAADNPQLYYKNGNVNTPYTKAEMTKLFSNKLAKARTDFGIEGKVADPTQVAANAPTIAPSGFMKTSLVGKPEREVTPVEAPPIVAPNIPPRVAPLISKSKAVGISNDLPQADADRIKLLNVNSSIESILSSQLDVQRQMLTALQAMVSIMPSVGQQAQGEKDAKPAIEKRDPQIRSFVPDREPREVSKPVVSMGHKRVL